VDYLLQILENESHGLRALIFYNRKGELTVDVDVDLDFHRKIGCRGLSTTRVENLSASNGRDLSNGFGLSK